MSDRNQGAFRASFIHPATPPNQLIRKMKTLRFLLPVAALVGAITMMAQPAQPMPMPAKKGMAMGDIRDREYRRFVVREESVRALADVLERLVAQRAFAGRA